MKVEYTNRAVADLRKASIDSRAAFGDAVAAALERRIRDVIGHIAQHRKLRHESSSDQVCVCFR